MSGATRRSVEGVGYQSKKVSGEVAVGAYLRGLSMRSKGHRAAAGSSEALGAREKARALKQVEAFVVHAGQWALDNGVEGRTLAEFGVPASVLTRAGLTPSTIENAVRAGYAAGPFSVSELAARVGLSASTVRGTLIADVSAGRIITAGWKAARGRPSRLYQLPAAG